MKKMIKSGVAILLIVVMAIVSCSCGAKTETEIDDANTITDYNIEDANYQLDVDCADEIKDISELLYGIFFEDINFSADGGLYAEKVANRSFEFTSLAKDNEMYAWLVDSGVDATVIKEDGSLNANNPNYLKITNTTGNPAGVKNRGFLEGMAVNKEKYNFSIYAKGLNGYAGGITVKLLANGSEVATGKIDSISADWQKYELSLDCSTACQTEVYLAVLVDDGEVAVDMVSLFPENTYKNRENGLRNDIATMLEELNPKFLRFPGGCVIEGTDETTAYDWKASVGADKDGNPLQFNGKYGDVAARRQGIDLWTDLSATDDPYPSFMSYGLGFYEFFQLAEDLGAVGVPVINAGMYCQGRNGEAVDINSKKFQKHIDDMLDLVEFCRGDESTTWGKVRCDMGHKEPFKLKYICVGNENLFEDYYKRYDEFVKAFNSAKKANPKLFEGIELVYSAGTDDATSNENYINAYKHASTKITDENNDYAGAIDHHYYNVADWFFKNADYYDEANYSRTTKDMDKNFGGKINVFLGEYASLSNRMHSALSESAYMTGLERNGDIVAMSTYAPLLSSVTARHWAPNLIWFDNANAMGSINYYTQKLFSTNQGTKLLNSNLQGAFIGDKEVFGRVGLGTWATSAKFDNVKITDNKTGEIIAEDDFSKKSLKNWQKDVEGKFKVKGGALVQTLTDAQTTDYGSVIYFGDTSWSDYTFTVEATKLGGEEGFFIPIFDTGDNKYYWNIGGYGNTVSCLQQFNYGYKTGQLDGTVKDFVAEDNKTYQLKVVADGTKIKCYIDDELYVDYDTKTTGLAEAYQVVSTDETGDVIIKLVNPTSQNKAFAIKLDNADVQSEATVYQVRNDDINAENVFGDENQTGMDEFTLQNISSAFNYKAPKYSATVIRIHRK